MFFLQIFVLDCKDQSKTVRVSINVAKVKEEAIIKWWVVPKVKIDALYVGSSDLYIKGRVRNKLIDRISLSHLLFIIQDVPR